jgi:hypothetical protein
VESDKREGYVVPGGGDLLKQRWPSVDLPLACGTVFKKPAPPWVLLEMSPWSSVPDKLDEREREVGVRAMDRRTPPAREGPYSLCIFLGLPFSFISLLCLVFLPG